MENENKNDSSFIDRDNDIESGTVAEFLLDMGTSLKNIDKFLVELDVNPKETVRENINRLEPGQKVYMKKYFAEKEGYLDTQLKQEDSNIRTLLLQDQIENLLAELGKNEYLFFAFILDKPVEEVIEIVYKNGYSANSLKSDERKLYDIDSGKELFDRYRKEQFKLSNSGNQSINIRNRENVLSFLREWRIEYSAEIHRMISLTDHLELLREKLNQEKQGVVPVEVEPPSVKSHYTLAQKVLALMLMQSDPKSKLSKSQDQKSLQDFIHFLTKGTKMTIYQQMRSFNAGNKGLIHSKKKQNKIDYNAVLPLFEAIEMNHIVDAINEKLIEIEKMAE